MAAKFFRSQFKHRVYALYAERFVRARHSLLTADSLADFRRIGEVL